MATVELTKDNFNEVVENNDFVILDFWAPWCGPCKNFAPIFEKVSENHQDIVFGKINTEEEQELAAYFQIRSIPTLMVMRERIMIFSQPWMLPESALEEIITKARELDMDDVRRQIAEQKNQQENGQG